MIDLFDIHDGWTTIPDPLGDDFTDLGAALEGQGFEHFSNIGIRDGVGVALYKHQDGRWYITIDSEYGWHPVIAMSFPAMLSVLKQAEAYLGPALMANFYEMFDHVKELLIQHPSGPLSEAQQDQWDAEARRRQAAQKARAAREAKKAAKDGAA